MTEGDRSQLIHGKYGIEDLVDLNRLRQMFESFTEATGFTVGFLDHPGMNVLVAAGWRDICTKFHRNCAVSAANCIKSNRTLLSQASEARGAVFLQCENGLMDCAVPVVIEGRHIASLVTGQLLFDEPDLQRFGQQAEAFGFDRNAYLEEVKAVPVVSEKKIESMMQFLGEMAHVISELGYRNLLIFEETDHLENEITERRRVESGLRLSEEKYRFLAEKMGDLVWTLDMNLRSTYIGPSIERVLGFTPEERQKMTAREKFTPESLRKINTLLREELERDKDPDVDPDRSVEIEVEYYHRNGTTLWLENTIKPIRDASGQLTGIYGVSRDVSQRRKAEKEKEVLQEQLLLAQKMESLGRLAGGVAHDFNNLLTVILGHTELALREFSPGEKLYSNILQIHTAAEHSAALAGQLLAFARKQITTPEVLNLNNTMSGMLMMLGRLIGENIQLVWKPGRNLWPVKIDPGQIDQIIANLCVNARDAIDKAGMITIETENISIGSFCGQECPPGDYVMITVSDTGHGIDSNHMKHLYEPFFTTKEIGRGTGLGLATVYGIVKQNSGCIDVRSSPGTGTTFSICLPRSEESNCDSPGEPAGELLGGCGETILLVEDEEAVLELTRTLLEELGYNVLFAGLPCEALSIAENHPGRIHLLLSDVVMPEMNGRDLAELIRAVRPEVKCLFMSGYTADIISLSNLSDQSVCFMPKPFTLRDIADNVRNALNSP